MADDAFDPIGKLMAAIMDAIVDASPHSDQPARLDGIEKGERLPFRFDRTDQTMAFVSRLYRGAHQGKSAST